MNAVLNKAEFDAQQAELIALARDLAERECTTFDEAVDRAAGAEGDGSIWDMPEIDSKRTVSLLTELEPIVGRKLPSSLIKRGGYANVDVLLADLFPKIRKLCPDAAKPGLAAAATSAAVSSCPPAQAQS